jgi:5-formaminoimidazole-4-carboxamide-1-beta-D-ribofuranosyl 5'-monophosphate synthetase
MVQRTKLTEKQKGFIDSMIKNKGNGVQSVKENYDLGSKGGSKTEIQKTNTAAIIAHENINKPKIQEVLNKHGITENYLTEKLKNNIETTAKDKYYNANLKGIELGYKLQGHLKDSGEKVVNNLIIGYINSSELKKIDDKDIIDVPVEQ